jgi:hypothetical protein
MFCTKAPKQNNEKQSGPRMSTTPCFLRSSAVAGRGPWGAGGGCPRRPGGMNGLGASSGGGAWGADDSAARARLEENGAGRMTGLGACRRFKPQWWQARGASAGQEGVSGPEGRRRWLLLSGACPPGRRTRVGAGRSSRLGAGGGPTCALAAVHLIGSAWPEVAQETGWARGATVAMLLVLGSETQEGENEERETCG